MAPKRRLRSNTSLASAASSEDTVSEFKIVQRPRKDPVATAPADQKSNRFDGDNEMGPVYEVYSSDEIGEDGRLTKLHPPSKKMAAAEVPTNNVASPVASPLERKTTKSPPQRKAMRKVPASAAKISVPPPLTGNEAADQRARSPSPEKTSGPAETAKLSPPKKAAAATEHPLNNLASPLKRKTAKSPPRRKTTRKHHALAAEVAMPPPLTGNEAADQYARSPSPEKAAGAVDTEAAKSSLPTKVVEAAELPTAKSPQRKKKTEKVSAPAAEIAMPPPLTRNEVVDQHVRLPSPEKAAVAVDTEAAQSSPAKKAWDSEAAKSPKPKKVAALKATNATQPKKTAARTEVVVTPPSPEAAAPTEAEKDLPLVQEEYIEKHFKEKTQMYWYLWQMVLTLEEEYSLPFKGAFLKINDTKASILNTELKNMRLEEMKQQVCWMDINKEVAQVLISLIK